MYLLRCISEDNTRKKVKGLAFNFKFKKEMFEPNMFLADMNNEDSNNHNYNHEDNNNNNERFLRDEEFDSANTKSGSENQEGGSGNDQDNHHPNKRNDIIDTLNFRSRRWKHSSKSVPTRMTSKGNNLAVN
ncbi:hypothetical protein Bca52824_061862 [Brassica carinata]|uniref:Uncharacterized protein n=1 Tax=Brassica carinata TaxID=52824 RepID=A0A8X7QBU1_BRACI|nr:hypothetical protein Bca52824_061862 [Brassica carinata]